MRQKQSDDLQQITSKGRAPSRRRVGRQSLRGEGQRPLGLHRRQGLLLGGQQSQECGRDVHVPRRRAVHQRQRIADGVVRDHLAHEPLESGLRLLVGWPRPLQPGIVALKRSAGSCPLLRFLGVDEALQSGAEGMHGMRHHPLLVGANSEQRAQEEDAASFDEKHRATRIGVQEPPHGGGDPHLRLRVRIREEVKERDEAVVHFHEIPNSPVLDQEEQELGRVLSGIRRRRWRRRQQLDREVRNARVDGGIIEGLSEVASLLRVGRGVGIGAGRGDDVDELCQRAGHGADLRVLAVVVGERKQLGEALHQVLRPVVAIDVPRQVDAGDHPAAQQPLEGKRALDALGPRRLSELDVGDESSRRRIDAPLKVIPAPVTDALLFVGRVVAAEGQDNPMIRDRVGEDLATAAAVVAIPLDRDEGKLGLEAGLSICVGHAIRRDRARGARPRSTERGEARRRRLRRCPAHRRRATVGAEGVQALRKHCRERFIVGRVRQAVSG
mmetsp:Transcript_14038/g.52605  ORF Transcript_14038/g.52605 Transcript_14038/m.52605 type:complete len:498 (+) Transcript_14038:6193-7686(+)